MAVTGTDASLDKLRSIVADCVGKHLYTSAIFYADKLVSLSESSPDDVYRLAQCYFYTKQYRRALYVLQRLDLQSNSLGIRFRYLAAKCMAECSDWEDCLLMLGSDTVDSEAWLLESQDGHLNMLAAMELLRGSVYETLDNATEAATCFKRALYADVFCFEAFERLLENHMLNSSEEKELLEHLSPKFSAEDEWLRLYYACKCQQPKAMAVVTSSLQETDGTVVQRLQHNADFCSVVAAYQYEHNEYQLSYQTSSKVLEKDPLQLQVFPIHVCCLLELNKKAELFYCAHKLVEDYPHKAVSWFAVGCYYHLTGDHENARRYFSKSTSLEHKFVPAWIGFGNAFAAQDESDQAMAAYRTTSRLFSSCYMPWLGIGMEHLKTNNLQLAEQYIRQAHSIAPEQPLSLHELGVVFFQSKEYEKAVDCFLQVLDTAKHYTLASCEATLFNLGHSYRKLRDYPNAIKYYDMVLSVSPHLPSNYSALGFTYHLSGQVDMAIEYYHKSLGLKPDDTFTSEMLGKALEEMLVDLNPQDLGGCM